MEEKNIIPVEQKQEEIMQEKERGIALYDGLKFLRLKRKLIKIAVIVVIVAAVAGIIWFQANRINNMQQRIDALINTPAIAEEITPKITVDFISEEIKGIGELATVEYLYTNAAKFEDSNQIKNWNIPLTKKSFILKWDGIIKAGIDVNEITCKVDETNKVLTICVPKAEILSHETDADSVELLDEKNGLFNAVSLDDMIEFNAEMSHEMEERAVKNGLLEKAQKNAEEIILNLINAIPGVEEYTIVFEVV